MLSDAGIDMTIFTPHSTRGASTSAVVGKIPILKTAGWASESVFRKFYKREVTNNPAFCKSIFLLCIKFNRKILMVSTD